ncbi:MAG: hypothetical protein J6Y28_09560 [Acholeplasmatales bacterium]|nr:hypothetical protein [Acholeplasmatales bacterium]
MADKKGYVSNKDKKKQEFEEQKRKQMYRNPSKTLAGKITIIFLICCMFAAPLIFLVYYLITQLS